MFDLTPFTPSKRRCRNEAASQPSNQPRNNKKQKCGLSQGSQPPARFWDNLSKIDLTKAALKELDRRNAQGQPNATHALQRRGLITRRSTARERNPPSVAAVLTRETQALKRFARHGGPDLGQLKGYPRQHSLNNIDMSPSRSRSRSQKRGSTYTPNSRKISNTTNTTSTKSTGPYSRNFQQNLVDGGVYPHAYRYPDGHMPAKPHNWEEISHRLTQPRSSLSPSKFSEDAHQKFVQADADAVKEKQVCASVIPVIEGNIADSKCTSGGIPFTNLDHLTDGTLVPGNPDVYYGARPEQLDRNLREELNSLIVPSTQDDLPILPNFVLAAKGPDGSLAVAGRQACYDGALGARSMHALQSYKDVDVTYDNKAYTITSIYHGGQLKMFTSHPYQTDGHDADPQYCMHQLNTWGMTGSSETFRRGATYYRNARDWAKEQRDQAIQEANLRARETQAVQLDLVSSSSIESSDDDVAADIMSQDIIRNEISDTTVTVSATSGEGGVGKDLVKNKRAHRVSTELANPQRKRQYAVGSNDRNIHGDNPLTTTASNPD